MVVASRPSENSELIVLVLERCLYFAEILTET